MSEFQIIPIDLFNIEKAIQVFCRAMNFPLDVEQSLVESTKLFLTQNSFIGIAITTSENIIIGFAGFIPMANNTAWIPYVGVEPSFQGQGCGRLLMENLIRISKEHNWQSLELVASKAGFPVYKLFDFRTDYNVATYEIKSVNAKYLKTDLDIIDIPKGQNLPDWVLEFDRFNLGINRSNIFPIHAFDNLKLISKHNEGYAIIYGKRIGPIISRTKELAREIIITGFSLGGESVVLINEPMRIDFLNKSMVLQMVPNTEATKMSYGTRISAKKEFIYGLRTMAYG